MGTKYPEKHRLLIEDALRKFFKPPVGPASLVGEAMSYSLFSGGKRFRSVLTLLSAEAVGGVADNVLPTACAVEYIHTYSLIHDDLPVMDNDSMRRGQPACHVRYGEDIALLAGDALLAEAFFLIADKQAGEAVDLVGVLKELSLAASVRGMVGGQVADILATDEQTDQGVLEYIHSHKTGQLIASAARVGAILSGATEPQLAAINAYAECLGMAFQITDDVLDVVGSSQVMGKSAGSDERQRKLTYPAVVGLDRSGQMAGEALQRAKAALDSSLLKTGELSELAEFVATRDS